MEFPILCGYDGPSAPWLWGSDSLWLWGSQFFVAVMVAVPHGYGVLIFHGFGGPGPPLGFPVLHGYDGPSAP